MDYPKHLYEKIREEIAISYVGHELEKIFPSISDEDLSLMLTRTNMRDFWNGVHGIGMGLKLHIGFIYLLTAENIKWKKEIIEVDELWFGVERSDTKMIRPGRISATELKEYFEGNEEFRKKQLKEFDKRIGFDDPVIAYTSKENGMDVIRIYEGNNRLYKAVLEKRKTLEAYVGRYTTDDMEPKNYWLPTSILMDNLYYIYKAIREENEAVFQAQIKALKYMLLDSESGRYEFENRALTSKEELRDRILKAIDKLDS